MMNVSASGGLRDKRPNSHRKGHSGRGLAPPSVGSGGALGPLWPEYRRERNDDDDGQCRKKDIFEDGITQKGDAGLQLTLILGVIGLRVDGLSRNGRAY